MKKLITFATLMIVMLCISCITASAKTCTNRGVNSIIGNYVIESNNDYYVKLTEIHNINLDYTSSDAKIFRIGIEYVPLKYTMYADEGII